MAKKKSVTSPLVFGALLSLPTSAAFAFAPTSPQKRLASTQTSVDHVDTALFGNAKDENNDMEHIMKGFDVAAGGAMAFLAGLGVAAQIAFADTTSIVERTPDVVNPPSSIVVSAGFTGSSGASFDTLDFSLPSYSEATGGSSSSEDSSSSPEVSTKSSVVDTSASDRAAEKAREKERKAEEKAAGERKAADEKAAKEKDAADEKAAKEKAKADRLAAAKRSAAEQAARRAAEIEEENKPSPSPTSIVEEKKEVDATPAFKTPDLKAPDLQVVPDFKVPDFKVPSFKAPDFKVPDFKAPDTIIKAPEFSTPELKAPELKAPEFKTPEIKAPKFKTPEFKASVPEFKAPEFKAPDVKLPEFKAPAVPKFDIPSRETSPPSSSASYDFDVSSDSRISVSEPEEYIEPQEVRDERAKEAKIVFKDAAKEAKAIEQEAKIARAKANNLKKEFNKAKDDACKTRPGGNILCVRGFTVGY